MVFITKMESVYCAVQTGPLHRADYALTWRVKHDNCVIITFKENAEYFIISTEWVGYHSYVFKLYITIKASSQNCEKRLLDSSRLSARPNGKKLDSNWKDFHEIWYFSIFRKSVEKIQDSSKSDTNNGYFTWRPVYIYDHI